MDRVKSLVEKGAALDAACGQKLQTVLHLAAVMGNKEVVQLLITSGADRSCLDANGKTAAQVCTDKACSLIFDQNHGKTFPRRLPQLKREFYVLIVERPQFEPENLERLPDRLNMVYGFKEGLHNLDDFTHFVIDSNQLHGKDLPLDLDNLLSFEILAKPGMIVTTEWLDACLSDPKQVDFDWKYQLTDISFEGQVHKNVIPRIKNDINRLRPPLLFGTCITILPTRNRIMREDRNNWIRIIEAFGGKYVVAPKPTISGPDPYHSLFAEIVTPIHSSILLYFNDSIVRELWLVPDNRVTLLGMAWLPESIVRYRLLSPDHGILRFEMKPHELATIFEHGPRYNYF
uniref:ANK_REP_REGION domain-containing protein n=1 Tax=Caenorhabditis japonica TaxID=281687 RepID=A0A8R1E8H9_CAEJA